MNSLNSVRDLLMDYLEEYSVHSTYRSTYESMSQLLVKNDFLQKVHEAFFNLIADPTQSPESIIHILDTYTSGLHGFSTNECLQTLVGFACLEGLASRRPEVLNGPWETLVWIIVKYTSLANAAIGNEGMNEIYCFKKTNTETLMLITEFVSAELCPNPCLRLELFRFIISFNYKDLDCDVKSYRDKIVNTLFELCDNYASLTVNQVPNFSPMDLNIVIEDTCISMEYLMNDSDLYMKKSEIIAAVLKLTRNFALLEKEKYQRLNNQAIEYRNGILTEQLSACLSFCGLIPILHLHNFYKPDDFFDHNKYLLYLVQAICNDFLLQNYVIDTLDTITQVSLCLTENPDLQAIVVSRKDKLLHRFFKGHINQLPTFQYKQELYGGISPAKEYRLRYFQSDLRDLYDNSDYNSEISASEDYESYASDENESDISISD